MVILETGVYTKEQLLKQIGLKDVPRKGRQTLIVNPTYTGLPTYVIAVSKLDSSTKNRLYEVSELQKQL